MNEWRKKIWYIYTIDYYRALRKGNPSIYDNLNETRGHYAKWKESEKDKYYIYIYIYVYLQKSQTQRNREQSGGSQD